MKKKLYIVPLLILAGVFLMGCSNPRKADTELEFTDKSGGVQSYVMDVHKQDDILVPRIELDKNKGTFFIEHDILASTVIGGTYKIKKNILLAETEDKKSVYQFKIIDGKSLKFIQDNSSEIKLTDKTVGIPITDGSIFKLEE
ncbi:MAG: hypothetical protein Q4F98_08875 [Lachnospiraceae bacterium]|nr:hypothetical protein [Lachnospiraceae bacterium]